MAVNNNQEVTNWVGWVYFAGFMLMLNGILQTMSGLTALLHNNFYLVTQSNLLVFNYTTWGWVHLVLGIVIICAGYSLFSGKTWARVVGTLVATLNFVAQFAFVSSYPVWSVIAMVLDVLVIYALTVHGGEARAEE